MKKDAILAMVVLLAGAHARGVISDNSATVLPVQAAARPFNLDIAGPVFQAGSDSRAAAFQADSLPSIMKFIDANLGEATPLKNIATYALDPSRLKLTTDAEVRVYFVGEGAGYHNTLGFSLDGAGLSSDSAQLIFPDATSRNSWYLGGGASATAGRSLAYPLLPGDFVDLGAIAGGSALDFFLIADGAQNPGATWWAESSQNRDGLQHIAAFALANSPYLLLGFEDLAGGGDKDYNDVVFAVDIGYKNVQHLANPEPPALLSFGMLALAAVGLRRQIARGARKANAVGIQGA